MNERRPPAPPAAPKPRPAARPAGDSTVFSPRPELTDEGSMEGGVFDGDDDDDDDLDDDLDADGESGQATHTMKAPSKTRSSTADVSVIEAREMRPAPSDMGFDGPPHTFNNDDGFLGDDSYRPATEVLRLAFSDPGGDSVTPTGDIEDDELPLEAAPVEVKKWKAGGGRRLVPIGPISEEGLVESHGPLISLPDTDVQAAAPQPALAGTRVDAVPVGARHMPFDVDELRRTLEEAEKLLRTAKSQASSLDLDLVAPGARGMNAQLAAALHRLGEALTMLGR